MSEPCQDDIHAGNIGPILTHHCMFREISFIRTIAKYSCYNLVRYGAWFVNSKTDLCFTFMVLYAICYFLPCYIEPDYTSHIPVTSFNSLTPGRFGCNYEYSKFNLALQSDIFRSSYDKALRWMSRDLTDDKSTSVQVMAWCRQATSHYPSQYWPRSMSPYGVTRPQWVKDSICIAKFFVLQLVIPWNQKQNIGLIQAYSQSSK